MKVVQIGDKIPEFSAESLQQGCISNFRGHAHKVDSHPFVELLISDAQLFLGRLAHFNDDTLGIYAGQLEIILKFT